METSERIIRANERLIEYRYLRRATLATEVRNELL